MERLIPIIAVIFLGLQVIEEFFDTYQMELLFVIKAIVVVIIAIVVIVIASKLIEAEKRRQLKEAQKKVAEEERKRNYEEQQNGFKKEMILLGEQSISIFESMPEYLVSAEEHLNQAEFEFSEGAYAPFWDVIEKAINTLGRFDEAVNNIKNNSSKYCVLIQRYDGAPPHFPLARKSVEKLNISTTTAKRLKEIVRNAQRNFEFATIYEQRKTNQILVAGFTNVAQALDQMTSQLTASIDNLASSVDSMASSLGESINTVQSRLVDIAEANMQQISRQEKALEMLDNIQHHRKPS